MKLTYVEAMARAMYEAAAADPTVLVLGTTFGGLSEAARAAFADLFRDFADRVLETPISELGLAGAGIGAALAGCRPIVDLSTGSFLFQAFPQVVNEAPNIHYMTGGQSSVPVVFHCLEGIRGGGAAQHSHRPQAMVGGVPGLQILIPSCPSDVYGLLRWTLLESRNPTVFFNHPLLFATEEDFDPAAPVLPFGRARICRQGTDVTIVATSVMVARSLAAAEELAGRHGVSAEVIDLRTLAPLDRETVYASVRRTGRLVVADECHKSFGAGAELAASVAEDCFEALRAPVCRAAVPDVPIPFSPALEGALVVGAGTIADAALRVVSRGGRAG